MYRPPNYNAKSKDRLEKIVLKHVRTAFIGALDKFENSAFGKICGLNKEFDELNDQEKKWRYEWNRVRQEIFDNGNDRIRDIRKELEEYDIFWNRHNYQFKVCESREEFEEFNKQYRNKE